MSASDPAVRKIAVVGLGAIGGWIAAALHRAGAEVSALARGTTLQALQTTGLTVHQDGQTGVYRLQASDSAAELGPQDVVVLAVKAPALRQVAGQVAPLLKPGTLVLTAMNGVPWWFLQGFGGACAGQALHSVDADGQIAAAFAAQPLAGGVVHCSATTEAPAVVRHHFGNGLILGSPSGQPSAGLDAVVALLQRGGIQASLSTQIQKDVWFKLWGNMSVNPVSAFTGATTDLILGDPLVRGFISAIMLEAKTIGARLGVEIDQQPEDRHQVTRKLGAFKTSMLQDVEAGRAVEIDALVSAVRELGQLTQTPTPMTDALLGLARLHARVRSLY